MGVTEVTVVGMWDKVWIPRHPLNRPPGELPADAKWECRLTQSFLFSELAS